MTRTGNNLICNDTFLYCPRIVPDTVSLFPRCNISYPWNNGIGLIFSSGLVATFGN